ncbi:MAG: ABATE domain-containing protein [Pseudomonadota bacterium]
MDKSINPATAAPAAPMEQVGDHPALDMMNTVQLINGEPVDRWQSGQDVRDWLARLGYWPAGAIGGPDLALLEAARRLREVVGRLVRQRKQGREIDVVALNALLAHASRHLELTPQGDGRWELTARYAHGSAWQLLAPLAESAAQLLAEADFDLIRPCENPQCVLWFLDRTKSHRRRWCSMAACGNRHKVASFRQRQLQGPPR